MEQAIIQKRISRRLKVKVNYTSEYTCVCQQNEDEPDTNTFIPCTSSGGDVIGLSAKHWKEGWFACERCGRIVDLLNTRRVVGYNRSYNDLTPQERRTIRRHIKRYGLPEKHVYNVTD